MSFSDLFPRLCVSLVKLLLSVCVQGTQLPCVLWRWKGGGSKLLRGSGVSDDEMPETYWSWGQMAVAEMAGKGSDEPVLLLPLDLMEGIVRALLFALVQNWQLPAFGSCCSRCSEVAVLSARVAEKDTCSGFSSFRSRCCSGLSADRWEKGRMGSSMCCPVQLSVVVSRQPEALLKTAETAFGGCPGCLSPEVEEVGGGGGIPARHRQQTSGNQKLLWWLQQFPWSAQSQP